MNEDHVATPEESARAAAECGEHPIMIVITAQEIGRMWAAKSSPTVYNQMLMEKFRAAGAPVEGVLNLTFAHGRLARVRPSREHAGEFGYVWLPDLWAAKMVEYQRWTRGEA